jgi:hypothetical protein
MQEERTSLPAAIATGSPFRGCMIRKPLRDLVPRLRRSDPQLATQPSLG